MKLRNTERTNDKLIRGVCSFSSISLQSVLNQYENRVLIWYLLHGTWAVIGEGWYHLLTWQDDYLSGLPRCMTACENTRRFSVRRASKIHIFSICLLSEFNHFSVFCLSFQHLWKWCLLKYCKTLSWSMEERSQQNNAKIFARSMIKRNNYANY